MPVLIAGERKTINSELWHACAGPLVSLPPVGSLVVYFPQGHSEQVCFLCHDSKSEINFCFGFWCVSFDYYNFQVAASMQKEADFIPSYPNLSSKLICMLHNVALHVGALCSCDMSYDNESYLRTLSLFFFLHNFSNKTRYIPSDLNPLKWGWL